VHLSSDGSSWLLRSSLARRLLLVLAVVVVFLLFIGAFVGWRWHEAHLPTPAVPSAWVNIGKAETNEVTMFKWVITGQQVAGIYVDDDLTNPGCLVEPFVGRIDGHSVSLTATFLNDSGTVRWSGTVSAHQLVLDGESYSPGSTTAFATALTAMKYPSCGPGSF
jgi:hypothetical protein